MGQPLDKITIKGFKSIREMEDFELRKLNVFIGGNGAGKSNLVELFRMLRSMVDQDFENYILDRGGANGFLFNGPKTSPELMAHFTFGANEYRFTLKPSVTEKFVINEEAQKYEKGGWKIIGRGNYQSSLPEVKNDSGMQSRHGVGYYVYDAISSWTVYHFHDTGAKAPMRTAAIVEDSKRFRSDASNIAPFLLGLRDGHWRYHYDEIVNAVRLVMPFFNDFLLEPVAMGEAQKVKLSWMQKGSDYPMQPYHLSDGSIRFICLATALLQPQLPSTIIIDEPELGLHPTAIAILAELMQDAAKRTQLIVSTQSPALIDYFSIEDVIVVNRKDGATTFERLQEKDFNVWLEDYTVGELWSKNVIDGGPSYE